MERESSSCPEKKKKRYSIEKKREMMLPSPSTGRAEKNQRDEREGIGFKFSHNDLVGFHLGGRILSSTGRKKQDLGKWDKVEKRELSYFQPV